MKSSSGWNNGGNGSNSSGFTGLPGGNRDSGGFDDNGDLGCWWSASESGSYSWERILDYNFVNVYRGTNSRGIGFSARCVRDSSMTSSLPTEPSSNRKLEKVVDALGREVKHTTNQILFHVYDDGSVEKKFVVD